MTSAPEPPSLAAVNAAHADGPQAYYGERTLSAVFHDLLASHSAPLRGDIAYYAGALPPRARVLELGCGSGRVAIALAAEGFHVTGVDLAPAMIGLANTSQRKLPPARAARVRFSVGDMTRCSLGRRFQAVLVPFYAFNHLSGPAARQQALDVVARHLAPHGRAYIHVLPPHALAHERDLAQQEGWTLPFNNGDFTLRCRPVQRTIDADARKVTQAVEYTVFGPDDALVRRSRELCTYHWFSDIEMKQAATRARLRVIGSRARFGPSSSPAPPDGGARDETLYVLSA
jgi:SAM-dependent methyltransferase